MYDVLAILRRSGTSYELTAGMLVRRTMVTTGAITNRIDRLAERGLVEGSADADDRRKVIVRLTPAGLALVHEVAEAYMASNTRSSADPARAGRAGRPPTGAAAHARRRRRRVLTILARAPTANDVLFPPSNCQVETRLMPDAELRGSNAGIDRSAVQGDVATVSRQACTNAFTWARWSSWRHAIARWAGSRPSTGIHVMPGRA
jgi:DNA-binding MarR family transcriptional regulator